MVELKSPRPPPIVLFRLLGFSDVHNLAAGGGLVSTADPLMVRRRINDAPKHFVLKKVIHIKQEVFHHPPRNHM